MRGYLPALRRRHFDKKNKLAHTHTHTERETSSGLKCHLCVLMPEFNFQIK